MPKAYWVARVDVVNSEPYSIYANLASSCFAKYGANVLARGSRFESLEGEARKRNVVIEFESMDKALECYHSTEYQAAKKHREGHAFAELLIVEGA
ncbi:DUF1330 domain-containing protein [Pseudomonas sp. BN411]|uniref:DUF1330 domain-containing protein n=1 Tax=Pseudomonas sp. BN411 TaxID=2567887 RepID=UPI00245746A0|nr:DUF1330 domain-containing protein [Pseudomonas sp. BN411]MDH4564223.1 DUF1330 domain-containing protein [Pseudomonas sp. BN411]